MSNSILDHSLVSSNGGNGNGGMGATPLLGIREAASLASVSIQTIRRYRDCGKLPCIRATSNSWTKYQENDIRKVFGLRTIPKEQSPRIACYVRCSSASQKTAIINQREKLHKIILDKEKENNPIVYEEIASSFSERKSLQRMLYDVIDGKLPQGSKIYATYQDRVARIPGMRVMIEGILSRYGVGITYTDKIDDTILISQELQDLISFVHVISSRQCAKRGGMKRKIDINSDLLKRCYELKTQGVSDRLCCDTINKEGFTDQHGKPYKYGCLGSRIRDNWEMLTKLYGNGKPKNNFEQWASEYLVKVNHKGKKRGKNTSRKTITTRYYTWCRRQDPPLIPCSQSTISRIIQEKYQPEITIGQYNRAVLYGGIALLTEGVEK